jgi:hypothetical protein
MIIGKKTKISLTVLAIGLVLIVASQFWFSQTVSGRIVDENNRPVVGAVVLVVWGLYRGMEGSRIAPLAYEEAVTDADGRYSIQGWGPKKGNGYMPKREPVVHIVREGYLPQSMLANEYPKSIDNRLFIATPEARQLNQTLKGNGALSQKELSEILTGFSGLLISDGAIANTCIWRDLPQFTKKMRFIEKNLNSDVPSFTVLECVKD